MSEDIKAYKVKGVGGMRADDQQLGLMRFVREGPATVEVPDLWMAIPDQLLPFVAIQAMKLVPQPEDPGKSIDSPAVLEAEKVVFDEGPAGELVLTLTIQENATLSYRLGKSQAQVLLVGLQSALGEIDFSAPIGTNPS